MQVETSINIRTGLLVITGSFFTFLANRMSVLVIPFVLLNVHNNPKLIGLVGASAGIGALLSSVNNTFIENRFGQSQKLLIYSLLHVSSMFLLVSANADTNLYPLLLTASGYLSGTAEVGISTARQGILSDAGLRASPLMLDRLMNAEESASKLAILLGAGIAGVTLAAWGTTISTCIILTLTVCASCIYFYSIKNTLQSRKDTKEKASSPFLLLPFPRNPRSIIIQFSFLRFISSGMWFSFSLGLAVYGKESELAGNGTVLVTAATLMYGIGTLIGSYVAILFADRIGIKYRLFAGWLGSSLMFILIGISIDNFYAVIAACLLGGFTSPMGIAALNAIIAKIEDKADRSEHQKFLNWGVIVSISAGSAFGGLALTIVSAPCLLVFSGGVVLVVLIYLFVRYRNTVLAGTA